MLLATSRAPLSWKGRENLNEVESGKILRENLLKFLPYFYEFYSLKFDKLNFFFFFFFVSW